MTKLNIENMVTGERIYVNTINCSIDFIEQLRKYIKTGILVPDEKEVKTIIAADAVNDFMTGKCIAPQMTYIKK